MYTLLHGFYKYLTQKDEYCVVILGLDNAGKTVSNGTTPRLQEDKRNFHTDLSGSGQNEVHQELQRPQSGQNHNDSGPQHWHHRCAGCAPQFLGLGRPTGAAIAVGQVLSGISWRHICDRFQ